MGEGGGEWRTAKGDPETVLHGAKPSLPFHRGPKGRRKGGFRSGVGNVNRDERVGSGGTSRWNDAERREQGSPPRGGSGREGWEDGGPAHCGRGEAS